MAKEESEKASNRQFTPAEVEVLVREAEAKGVKIGTDQANQGDAALQKAQSDVIDDAVRKSVKRFELNPASRYLLIFDGRKIQPDVIREFALSLARLRINNVLIHISDDIEAITLFKEQTK